MNSRLKTFFSIGWGSWLRDVLLAVFGGFVVYMVVVFLVFLPMRGWSAVTSGAISADMAWSGGIASLLVAAFVNLVGAAYFMKEEQGRPWHWRLRAIVSLIIILVMAGGAAL